MSASRAAYRHPPAFHIDMAPQPRLQGLVALIALLSMASLIAGLALHAPQLAGWAWLLLPLAAIGGWRLARVESRRLRWDGQAWQLGEAGAERAVEIEILFDLGDWLLLRSREAGWRRCYLPLRRAAVGPAWGSLRATLHAARALPLPP